MQIDKLTNSLCTIVLQWDTNWQVIQTKIITYTRLFHNITKQRNNQEGQPCTDFHLRDRDISLHWNYREKAYVETYIWERRRRIDGGGALRVIWMDLHLLFFRLVITYYSVSSPIRHTCRVQVLSRNPY